MLQTAEHGKSSRLHLATFAIAHAFDHYGHMVEYFADEGACAASEQGTSKRIVIDRKDAASVGRRLRVVSLTCARR
jgi:hypothetical protein